VPCTGNRSLSFSFYSLSTSLFFPFSFFFSLFSFFSFFPFISRHSTPGDSTTTALRCRRRKSISRRLLPLLSLPHARARARARRNATIANCSGRFSLRSLAMNSLTRCYHFPPPYLCSHAQTRTRHAHARAHGHSIRISETAHTCTVWRTQSRSLGHDFCVGPLLFGEDAAAASDAHNFAAAICYIMVQPSFT